MKISYYQGTPNPTVSIPVYPNKLDDNPGLPITRNRPSLWRAAALLAGSSVFAQLLTVASMPLVTRLFSTEQIGAVSVFIVFLGIPSACAALRYDGALMVAKEQVEINRLTVVGTLSVALVAMVTGSALTVLNAAGLFGLGVLPWWSSLLAIPVVCGLGVSSVFRAVRLRHGDFSVLAATAAIRNFWNVVIRLAGGACRGGLTVLLLAEVVSAWAAMRRLAGGEVKPTCRLVRNSSMAELAATMRRWKRFPLYEIPSLLLDQIAAAIPLLIVAERLGPGSAGLFALANRFATLLNAHLGAAVGDVFRSRFADLVRAGEFASAKHLYHRLLKRAGVFAFLLLVPMVLLAPPLFGHVFGDAWKKAGMLVPWLAVWAASSLVVSPLSPLLQILQRQNLKWIYDVSAVVAMLIAVVVSSGTSLEDHVRALALAGVAGNVVYFSVLTMAVRRI